MYEIRFKDIVDLKLNKSLAKISKKKNQQKELYLKSIETDKKTRNYIFFFLCRTTKAEKIINELIIDFGGQNDTENSKISIHLLHV